MEKDSIPKESGSSIWLIFAFILVLVLIAVSVFGFFFFNPGAINSGPQNQTTASQSANLEARVSISETGFVPVTIKIKKGTELTWINDGETTHQIASDPHPLHDDYAKIGEGKILEVGQEFSVTFDEIGTFSYHDHYNPEKFTGSVIVE